MKRNILYALFAACIALIFIVSCDPLEPSTFTENFFRIATVRCKDGKASLQMDYTGENFNIDNFKTESDMRSFELKDGDRIIAELEVNAVGTMDNNKLTFKSVVENIPLLELAKSRPADTLNYDYQFNVLWLVDQRYPAIWSQGHLVNIAPIYYVPSQESVEEFYLYPMQMNKDTLEMILYSYIPDNNLAIRGYSSASQSLLCFDISTLRDSVADATEQKHRRDILKDIEGLSYDSIMVHIFAPDTLRGNMDGIYYERYPRVSVSISIPFDF